MGCISSYQQENNTKHNNIEIMDIDNINHFREAEEGEGVEGMVDSDNQSLRLFIVLSKMSQHICVKHNK